MFKRLLFLGLLGGAALFFHFLARDAEEVSIVRLEQPSKALTLVAGQTMTEMVRVSPGTYTGVVLYSYSPLLSNQHVRVSVSADGRLLARSYYMSARYNKDDLLRLRFTTLPFTVSANEKVAVTIEQVGGSPLLLAALADRDDGGEDEALLVMSLRKPVPVSTRTQQGAVSGLVIASVAALLEMYVPIKRRWWLYAVLLCGATFLALSGFWFSDGPLGIADWDYYFSLHHYYRTIILEHHQFPWWNPYTCGGTAGLGDPEFPVFSVKFLWEFLLGIPLGVRAAIFSSVSITGIGMLMLAKRLGLQPLSAFLAAMVTTFSTVTLLEIVEGHVNVLAALWIPWIFWSWYSAYQAHGERRRQTRYVLGCAVFLALTFYSGGIYLLMYTALAFMLLWVLVPRRRMAVTITVQAGVIAFGLAAFKLIPVVFWLKQFPDEGYALSTTTLPHIFDILLGRYVHGAYVIFGQDSGWHEYGAYIGGGAFILALIGLVTNWKRRLVAALGIAALAAILLSSAGLALESVFDRLWFFPRSNISRFILFAVIPLGLLAGFGLQALRQRLSHGFLLSMLVVSVIAVDLFSLDTFLSSQAFVLPHVTSMIPPPSQPIMFTAKRFDATGTGSRMTRTYDAARLGYGVFSYCSVLGPDVSSVRTVEDGEGNGPVWIESKDGTVNLVMWSPNKVVVDVHASVGSKVGLNTNFANGWFVNGEPAQEIGNRVGIPIEAGDTRLTFSYGTPGRKAGLAITLFTIVLFVGWWVQQRKRT